MDQTRFEYANLCYVAYQPIEDKYRALRKYGLSDKYFILPKFTNINTTTFYNWQNQTIVLAIRGTDIAIRYTTNRPLAGYIDILSMSDSLYNPSIIVDKKEDLSTHSIQNFTPRL